MAGGVSNRRCNGFAIPAPRAINPNEGRCSQGEMDILMALQDATAPVPFRLVGD